MDQEEKIVAVFIVEFRFQAFMSNEELPCLISNRFVYPVIKSGRMDFFKLCLKVSISK